MAKRMKGGDPVYLVLTFVLALVLVLATFRYPLVVFGIVALAALARYLDRRAASGEDDHARGS
jgi:hypothetical protein